MTLRAMGGHDMNQWKAVPRPPAQTAPSSGGSRPPSRSVQYVRPGRRGSPPETKAVVMRSFVAGSSHVARACLAAGPARPTSHNAVLLFPARGGRSGGAGVRPLVPLAPDAPGRELSPVFLLPLVIQGAGAVVGPPIGRRAFADGGDQAVLPVSARRSAVLRRESRLHRAPGLSLHGGGAGRRCRSTSPGHQPRLDELRTVLDHLLSGTLEACPHPVPRT